MVIPLNNISNSTQPSSAQDSAQQSSTNSATTQGAARSDSPPPPPSGGQKSQSSSSGDNVSLSSQGLSIASLEAAIEDAPDINQAKIDEIKSSINAGTYKPDANKIAYAILAQEDLLN